MKYIIIVLSSINGLFMLIDGLYVTLKGKYIGPEKPGPWAELFYKFDINVFKLGPLFILFGIAWLMWVYSFITNQNIAYINGIIICILTLWYLPIGTFISVIILIFIINTHKLF